MCGICGVLRFGEGSVTVQELERMATSMAHRGPDGHGTWVARGGRVGFGHRRLSIVDLSEAGHQPMSNEDGTVWITFNGEIYNHLDLRSELEARGHVYRSRTDTETILHAYEEWGDACIERFAGMFAFGIWDGPRERLFLARDRVGIKPLYFTSGRGRLAFASEIKAILALGDMRPDVAPLAMLHYTTFVTTPAPLTMFADIYKLPAGFTMVVERDGTTTQRQYWDALAGPEPDPALLADFDACAGHVRDLLRTSIRRRMMADVPFGVLLSGGVDSSLNVALMSELMDRPVQTFTVGFAQGCPLNEFEHARRVAAHFGADHHEVVIGEEDMRSFLPELVFHQDEPLADWVCIPLHFVTRLARSSGTLVVQVGEGSDEQFCGYDWFPDTIRRHERYQASFFLRLPPALRRLVLAALRVGSRLTGRGCLTLENAERMAGDRELFWGGAICFTGRDRERLVAPGFDAASAVGTKVPWRHADFDTADPHDVVRHYLSRFDRACPGADFGQRMTYLEFKLRLVELLLMRVDKLSMSNSVEARVPFLDHELVEFSAAIPTSMRLRGGVTKAVLKHASRGILPDEVIDRPKMGFGAPMAEWLRGDFGRQVWGELQASGLRKRGFFDYEHIGQLVDRHRRGAEDRSFQIWNLYNLTRWYDRWVGA